MYEDEQTAPIAVERIPDQEAAWREEIAALTVKLQDMRKPLQSDAVLRGVHPKSHGCVDAEFIVKEDLDPELQIGLFAQPGKCYRAKIRYSNAAVVIAPDLDKSKSPDEGQNGSRGMAIKVFDVEGPVLYQDGKQQNQDFLLINTPEFAFGNVRDYLRLTRALAADERGVDPKLFFAPLILAKLEASMEDESEEDAQKRQGLRRLLEAHKVIEDFTAADLQATQLSLMIAQKIQKIPVRNPLQVPYFSAAPFRFGPDRVVKFSAVPLGEAIPQAPFSQEEAETIGPDYLAEALHGELTQGEDLRLSFRVQVATETDLEGRENEMIENASIAWDETAFPAREVGQIKIHPVAPDAQLVDACKALFFTPWHALAAHEPLGGINRLRKPVYNKSAEHRRAAGAEEETHCEEGA